jgi:hypothetical protein
MLIRGLFVSKSESHFDQYCIQTRIRSLVLNYFLEIVNLMLKHLNNKD